MLSFSLHSLSKLCNSFFPHPGTFSQATIWNDANVSVGCQCLHKLDTTVIPELSYYKEEEDSSERPGKHWECSIARYSAILSKW